MYIKKYNYNLIVCSTDNQPEKELSYLKLLLEKKVDGIVLNTTGSNREFIASVSHQIPFCPLREKSHVSKLHR